jgi:hypothetical protein
MKILYITPTFQHPRLRGPQRHYYFIRELSRRHQITLLSLTKSAIIPEAMEEMRGYTEQIYTFNANGVSGSMMHKAAGVLPGIGKRLKAYLQHRRGVSEMKNTFERIARDGSFDLVLFHGKPVFRVIEDWDALPIVVDFCDATSMRYAAKIREIGVFSSPLLLLRYLRVRHVEKKLMSKTRHLAFISSRDRSAVAGVEKGTKIIPLGIDLDFWKRSTAMPRQNRIIFTGVMDYLPNAGAAVLLIQKILPRLREIVPDVELIIAGRNPTAELTELAQKDPKINVTGFVEDLRPCLECAMVYVAPVHVAAGTQNKVVEALAMQVPVVTTPVVCDGLRVDERMDPPVLVADTAEAFARQIALLLKSSKDRELLMEQGRRYVENHYNWRHSARILEEMCEAAVEKRN